MPVKRIKHLHAKGVKSKNANPSKSLRKNVLERVMVHTNKPKPRGKKVLKVKMSARAKLERIRAASVKRAANAKTKKILAQKEEAKEKHEKYLVETKKIGELVGDKALLSAVSNSVGAGAVDVLKSLVDGPKTDEDIAEKLSIKVNEVRRALNVMNSYSIVRYDVNKDSKGWLIFTWRIDSERLSEYVAGIKKEVVVADTILQGNCNDFFVCKGCYSKEKVVLPFDSAFETGFVCQGCGKPFALLSREETVALFKVVSA